MKHVIENIDDHKAKVCTACGSVRFCLLRSRQIECARCGLRGKTWGDGNHIDNETINLLAESAQFLKIAKERRGTGILWKRDFAHIHNKLEAYLKEIGTAKRIEK